MARLHWFSALVSLPIAVLSPQSSLAAGTLVPRNGMAPIAIQSHRIRATIEDGLARTTVRQTFVNPHQRALEAIYTFPLPEGAALVDVAMETGGQRLEGLLVERREARRVYDEIVRRDRDPALVEKVGRSTFRLSVFPVLPAAPTVVELTYIESLTATEGVTRYVYPLALANENATTTTGDLTATITVRSSAPLAAIESPTPHMAAHLTSNREGIASLEISQGKLDRDLVVVARTVAAEPLIRVHTYRAPGAEAFFAAVIVPPDRSSAPERPRAFTLVLDVSGSMSGAKLEQTKAAAKWWLEHLPASDFANVVLFSDRLQRFAPAPIPMSTAGRAALIGFVAAATDNGSTDLGSAIEASIPVEADPTRTAIAVLLTDGKPTVGITKHESLVDSARLAAARHATIHTFGIGADVDPTLLGAIAEAAGGSTAVIRDAGDIESSLREFLVRAGAPAWRRGTLTIGGRACDDVLPRGSLALIPGIPLVVTGRHADEGVFAVSFDDADPATPDLVAHADFGIRTATEASGSLVARDLYARTKLAWLEQSIRRRDGLDDAAYHAALDRGRYSTTDELVRAQVDLSLETGVQCAYTSFLALLPEDRARLNSRDPLALQEALQRVAERKRTLAAGPGANDENKDDVVSTDLPPDDIEVSEEVANSTQAFEGTDANQAIGVGGGGSGRFGGKYGRRGGGKGGGRASQKAVDLGLAWLPRHQNKDGSWSSDAFTGLCQKNECSGKGEAGHDLTVTSLALLANLGAGNTPSTGRYKDVVKNGLRWLVDHQDVDTGEFVKGVCDAESLRAQALATLALCEGYGLSKWPQLKEPAQKGIDALLGLRNSAQRWRIADAPRSADDVAAMAWIILALRSARDFGLELDPARFDQAIEWLESITDPATHCVVVPDIDSTSAKESRRLEAMTVLCRILLGQDPEKTPAITVAADRLLAMELHPGAEGTIDHEFAFFGSCAMYQLGGKRWDKWQAWMIDAVVKAQVIGGDEDGSWDPAMSPGSARYGRVYSTALHDLCLEVYYRYDRVLWGR